LAEFGQVGSVGAWYVGGAATLTAVTTTASTLEDCAAACKADVNCEYITYDYTAVDVNKKCFKKVNSAEDVAYAGIL
jgi:hypothetical protein